MRQDELRTVPSATECLTLALAALVRVVTGERSMADQEGEPVSRIRTSTVGSCSGPAKADNHDMSPSPGDEAVE